MTQERTLNSEVSSTFEYIVPASHGITFGDPVPGLCPSKDGPILLGDTLGGLESG